MRTDHFTRGKKYRKLVNNTVFIRNKSLFFVSAVAMRACIPIRAHVAVPTQRMPRGLSNTDNRIWENISHVSGEYYGRVYEVYIYTEEVNL